MNKASLLFHGASLQWSSHTVWAIVQAHTARSSRRLYGMLLRSHFVSRNKILHCVYFSIHFRIKFLLFNDFPSYIHRKRQEKIILKEGTRKGMVAFPSGARLCNTLVSSLLS